MKGGCEMLTTVYFATNRALTGPAQDWRSYGATIVTPSDPAALTYATAFVDNTDLTADTTGAITDIRQINTALQRRRGGRFVRPGAQPAGVHPWLRQRFRERDHPRRLQPRMVRAIRRHRGRYDRGRLQLAVIGRLLDPPLPWTDYLKDQTMAGQSALHLMSFFANLQPIVDRARQRGNRVFLLAHSMGNWALQAAVESWFSHGNGDALLFDETILAAADEVYNSFDYPPPGRLSDLSG